MEISDLDLDKFDKMFCLMEANFSGFPDYAVEIALPFTDGVFVRHSWGNSDEKGFVPTRQQDGLWTLHAASRYNGNVDLLPEKPQSGISRWCFKQVYAWRDITKTRTTEVSTMAVTNDQPISAGNLKAALDGLTGGSLLKYKILLRNDTDSDGDKTFTLQRSVTQYDFLLIFKGRIDSTTYPATDFYLVYHNKASNAWSKSEGSESFNSSYYSIEGNKWIGSGFNPDPPRLVIGFKI